MADLNPINWNWNQFKAAGKHVASYAAGGITMAVAFHFLTPAQGADITTNIGVITDGLTKVATGLAGLAAVVAPIYTAFKAAHSASPEQEGKSLVIAANNDSNPAKAQEAQKAIAAAVIDSNDLKVDGKILAPAPVAAAIPSEKVVPK